jgi:hypothetical protein
MRSSDAIKKVLQLIRNVQAKDAKCLHVGSIKLSLLLHSSRATISGNGMGKILGHQVLLQPQHPQGSIATL